MVISRVPNEDTCSGPGVEFVRGRCRHVGAVQAPEHAEVLVAWRDAEEQVVWRGHAGGFTGPLVEEVYRGV